LGPNAETKIGLVKGGKIMRPLDRGGGGDPKKDPGDKSKKRGNRGEGLGNPHAPAERKGAFIIASAEKRGTLENTSPGYRRAHTTKGQQNKRVNEREQAGKEKRKNLNLCGGGTRLGPRCEENGSLAPNGRSE